MAATPEGKIKAKLDRMLKEEDVWFFPPQAGPYGKSGIPDRILCVRGKFVGVEAKADKNKELTALQKLCRADILSHGGVYFTVYDTDTIENVRRYIYACNPAAALTSTKAYRLRTDNDGNTICEEI